MINKIIQKDSRINKELYLFHCINKENKELFKILISKKELLESKEDNEDTILHLIAQKETEFNLWALE